MKLDTLLCVSLPYMAGYGVKYLSDSVEHHYRFIWYFTNVSGRDESYINILT